MVGIEMKVKDGSKRKGSEMQRIVDNYLFLDRGDGKFFRLVEEEWFVDYLEECAEIVSKHYETFRIQMICAPAADGSYFSLGLVFARHDENLESKSELVNLLLAELNRKYPQMDILMFVHEISDPAEYERLQSGAYLDDLQ
ncbi:MAG: hypothetical protein IKV87_07635 [Methanobrevibacter sp.]|nr:hypothetical protein [Methanobrevibacter sp.]